jgi:hypothetical protein
VDPVEQPWSARLRTDLELLWDKGGVFQNSKVLANRIVVELYVVGELSDAYWSLGLGDIAKQVVASRISEGARFNLNLVNR